jgi:YidC/Oxa1 family membrane protein insertase
VQPRWQFSNRPNLTKMNIFNTILIQPLTNGLILFYELLGHNLGLAIVAFSILLRFILNPLTKPYMQSMKKMKEFQPQLSKLQQKYGADKKGLMAAQAEFYKQNKINPGAGCLPYLLQIVILISLFNVFTKVLAAGAGIDKLNALLYSPLKFADGSVLQTSFLYLNLSKPDVFRFAFLPFPIPGPFIIFAALVQFLSSKMMAPAVSLQSKVAEKTPGKADDISSMMQSSMTYTFPLMTLVFGMSFPSGLAIYWFLFSVFQFVQQYQSSGWGGLSPWLFKLGLLKSPERTKNDKG